MKTKAEHRWSEGTIKAWDRFRKSPVAKVVWVGIIFPVIILRTLLVVLNSRDFISTTRKTFSRYTLPATPGEAKTPSAPKVGFVVLSIYKWDGIWHRPQQTFSRVKDDFPVVYVRPQFFQKILGSEEPILGDRVERRDGNLVLFEPVLLSGEDWWEPIKTLNRMYLQARIYRLLREMGCEGFVLWYNFPQAPYLVGESGEAALAYDILDEYAGFEWATEGLKWREELLLREADVTFAGTGMLYRRKKDRTQKAHFLPCGVEFDHFNAARSDDTPLPDDLPVKSGPVLGYFGMVDTRIDAELLTKMLDKHPDWQVVLIGPVVEEMREPLAAIDRVICLGLRDYSLLPKYLKYWDVSLIPFVLNEVTRNINPTKLLEYLSAGKPVVTPAIPDVVEFYGDVVRIGDDHDSFIKHCEEAVTEQLEAGGSDEHEKTKVRLETARGKTWEAFVDFVMDEVFASRQPETVANGGSPKATAEQAGAAETVSDH